MDTSINLWMGIEKYVLTQLEKKIKDTLTFVPRVQLQIFIFI